MVINIEKTYSNYTLHYLGKMNEQKLLTAKTFLNSEACIRQIKLDHNINDPEDIIVSQIYCSSESANYGTTKQRIFLPWPDNLDINSFNVSDYYINKSSSNKKEKGSLSLVLFLVLFLNFKY